MNRFVNRPRCWGFAGCNNDKRLALYDRRPLDRCVLPRRDVSDRPVAIRILYMGIVKLAVRIGRHEPRIHVCADIEVIDGPAALKLDAEGAAVIAYASDEGAIDGVELHPIIGIALMTTTTLRQSRICDFRKA